MQMGYREGFLLELEQGKFSLDDVYFADETELVYGLAPRFGYSAKPLFAAEAHKSRGSGKVFIHAIISRRGVVKLWLTNDTGDDQTVCSFMLDDHVVPADAPETGGVRVFQRLLRGAILMWDRLGRAGRTQYPHKSHYNPRIKKAANDAGVGLGLLPPKGAEFNPIELFFLVLKALVYKMLRPSGGRDDWAAPLRGPGTLKEARAMVSAAVKELNQRSNLFRYFYHRRAFGSDAYRRWQDSEAAARVRAARGPCQFSLISHCFAPVHPNVHAAGPPKTAAQRKALRRYLDACAAAGLEVENPAGAGAEPAGAHAAAGGGDDSGGDSGDESPSSDSDAAAEPVRARSSGRNARAARRRAG